MKQIVMKYLKPFFPRMGVGFAIKFIGTVMDLFIPYILAYIIDTAIPLRDKNRILLWGGAMLLCSVLAVLFNVVANRMASKVASDATEIIRRDLFSKIMSLSCRQTDYYTKPSLISRMTTDTYNLHAMFARMQRLGVRAPILLIGGIIVTFTLDVFMALVLFGVLPILVLITVYVSKRSIPMYGKLQKATDGFVRMVREDISGMRVIKALSKTDYESERFKGVNRSVADCERKTGMVMAVISPSMNILLNLGLVCVIIVGAVRVNNGTSEVGKILAFTTYFTIILNAMLSISRIFEMFSRAIASGDRIWQVLESDSDLQVKECFYEEAGNESDRGGDGSEIAFENVTFSYHKGGKANLKDISFKLKKGQTLGIIGATGSGKSTVINLLMRLYDADEGRITIGGRDIRSYSEDELKKKFGVVFQNDTIFENTISENITLGREHTDEQLKQAMAAAQASEFVEGRNDREESGLSIKGANLSGGQKQRVLIARALLAKPEILILDDSSSALDYKTDAMIRKCLKADYKSTTLVIVAQRVSSVRNADNILVLEEGMLKGSGKHEELMENCSIYREISLSQMGE